MQIRDKKLLDGIEKHRYLRTDQAAELYFQAIKKQDQRQNKARERLLMLYKNKLVDRARYPNEPYIYYIKGSPRSHKMNHYLTITEVLLKIKKQLPTGSYIQYEIESKHEGIITDLVIYYKNNFRREEKTLYIEVELSNTNDIGAKIQAYEDNIDDGVLIVVCKHLLTLRKVRETNTDLKIIATDLDVNLGGISFK